MSMTKDDLIDRICQVSSFLAGYGDAAEIAAQRLRDLMDDMDRDGLEAADPILPESE